MQRSYHAATAWAAEGRFQQGRQQASCSGQQHPACTHALACAPPRLVMDCRIWRTVIGPSAATQPEEYFIVKSVDPRLSSRLQATDIALKMHFSMQAPSTASQRATCGYLSCTTLQHPWVPAPSVLLECPQSLVRQPSSQRQLHPCFTFGTTSASCTGNILSMLCKIFLQAASDHYLRLPQIVSVLFACVSAVCAWFAYDSAACITWTRCVYSSAL